MANIPGQARQAGTKMANYAVYLSNSYLRAVGRKVLWSSACVCLSVCLSVCLCVCAHCFCPQDNLKNGFMDHHQIWWVGAGGEPLEQVQFWC